MTPIPDEDLTHRSHRFQVENAEEFAWLQDEPDILKSREGFAACPECHPPADAPCQVCAAVDSEHQKGADLAREIFLQVEELKKKARALQVAHLPHVKRSPGGQP